MGLRLRFTRRSREHLANIRRYIARDRPQSAELVRGRILETITVLGSSPRLGRIGQRQGTRAIVVAGLPYVIIYRIDVGDADALVILGIFHVAQAR